MTPTPLEIAGTLIFAIAILHTFLVQKILHWSHQFPKDSVAAQVLHLFGEIEIVFGFWAAIFFVYMIFLNGSTFALDYQQSLNFTEPLFVFCIMVMSATRPILTLARNGIQAISLGLQKALRTPQTATDIFVVLTIGPLLGSVITEPAAMTVTALLLASLFHTPPKKLAYVLMAVLFVNVSVGGALTPFAAPPLLMVASKFGWDFPFVFKHFGLKSMLTVFINALLLVVHFRKQLPDACYTLKEADRKSVRVGEIPAWVTGTHILLLVLVVLTAHYASAFMGIFMLFLGVTTVTQKYQDSLRLRESLLVAFFLAGIVVFGAFQKWWLAPLLAAMSDAVLFVGATSLTAITDNAALTYLGSQVPDLSEASRYALVAGAIAGGGLTVIANAPNPAGFSILNHKFPGGNVNPLLLFVAALIPTAVAVLCLWFVPH